MNGNTNHFSPDRNSFARYGSGVNPPLSHEILMVIPYGENKAINAETIIDMLHLMDKKIVERTLEKMVLSGKIQVSIDKGKSSYYRS